MIQNLPFIILIFSATCNMEKWSGYGGDRVRINQKVTILKLYCRDNNLPADKGGTKNAIEY